MKISLNARTAFTLAALLSTMPATANSGAKTIGGVYPLKLGIYVQNGTECKGAPNAAMREYNGRGISDPHTHACIARVLTRRGQRYSIMQSCVDAGTGPAPRVSEQQLVTVLNATSFSIKTNGPGTTYRFCPKGF